MSMFARTFGADAMTTPVKMFKDEAAARHFSRPGFVNNQDNPGPVLPIPPDPNDIDPTRDGPALVFPANNGIAFDPLTGGLLTPMVDDVQVQNVRGPANITLPIPPDVPEWTGKKTS